MEFDINFVRSVITVLSFVSFLGIVWWAYHKRSKKEFALAEQLPFADTVVAPPGEHRPH
jgi:cytochrome c oxidase cbb3-type subunit IV